MLDLKKLNNMLDSALQSESTESLNRWIEKQIEADRANGIIRDAEFGILNLYDKPSKIVPLDKDIIDNGMSIYVNYNKVDITDAFDSSTIDDYNLVA